MSLEIEQKLTVRKVLLSIIGGLIAITIFRYALSLAIESRYGIDTDVYYMGRTRFSVAIVFTIVISSFIGAFFAGSVAKKKGYAIAIGHPHKVTMEALQQAKSILSDVEIVYIDDVFK